MGREITLLLSCCSVSRAASLIQQLTTRFTLGCFSSPLVTNLIVGIFHDTLQFANLSFSLGNAYIHSDARALVSSVSSTGGPCREVCAVSYRSSTLHKYESSVQRPCRIPIWLWDPSLLPIWRHCFFELNPSHARSCCNWIEILTSSCWFGFYCLILKPIMYSG